MPTNFYVIASSFLFTVFLTAILTGFFRQYALRVQLLDHPNDRSSHQVSTPRGGGIIMVLVFVVWLFILWHMALFPLDILRPFVLCGGAVFVVGVLDDYLQLSARVRLLVHLLSSVALVYFLPTLPILQIGQWQVHIGFGGFILLAISLAWLLNLYNFMDGIDGLASCEACTVAGGALCIIMVHSGNYAYMLMLLGLIAVCLGFLFWNLPPAKIFMGDGCSGFLGFCLGWLALVTSVDHGINLWSWLILLSLFIVDATVTLFTRIIRGDKFLEPHRSHAYQILSRRWGSHGKVTLLFCVLNLFYCLPLALLVSFYPGYGVFISGMTFLLLTCLAIRIGAGTTND